MISAAMSVHVADGHPRAADASAHQVLREQREHRQEAERHQVAHRRRRLRPRHHDAEHRARRRRDRAGGVVVVEPADPVEQPHQEELRGQRGDGQVEALDAQAGDAEDHADGGREHAGEQEHHDDVELRERRHQLVGGVGPDGHEPAGAERQLSGVAGEQVEADRGEREDDRRDQDRLQPVLVGRDGHDREGGHGQRDDEPAILRDREDRLVGGVAGLELAGLAVDHGPRPSR